MDNRYLVICNAYPREYDNFYISLSGCDTTISSVIYSNSIVRGLAKNKIDHFVISAASVGHYPFTSKTKKLPPVKYSDNFYGVGYNNSFLRSQASKTKSIWKEYKKHFFENDELNIIVTDIHTPFIKAALKIKKHNPNSRIVLVCLDLPQYVKSNSRNVFLKFLKKLSINQVNRLSKKVDGYVFLSKYMEKSFGENNKPSIISPCILDTSIYDGCAKHKHKTIDFVYCGVLSKQYGLPFLLESFGELNNPSYRLLLAGKGDAIEDIQKAAILDKRIKCLGEVSRKEACQIQFDADVLVNPRLPDSEFVKLSFPSKTIAFLYSGNPVCCYDLPSFPEDIKSIVNKPTDLTPTSFAEALEASVGKKIPSQVEIAKRYDEKNTIQQFVALFRKIRKK